MGAYESAALQGAFTIALLARPEELSQLRQLTRYRLVQWGLGELADVAQLCVSELVTNVIRHVGDGVPITLGFSLKGVRLRIELTDPDPRALPVLLAATDDAESGRGLALLNGMTAGWGVVQHGDSKIVWCELDTGFSVSAAPFGVPRISRAEALLTLYGRHVGAPGPLANTVSQEVAIDMIADLLHWLRAHGHDPDTALDHAQTRFEAAAEVGRWN